MKPLDGSGSAGVSAAYAAYARATGAAHTGRSGIAQVLVEEYLTGPEISVESLSEGGEHCVVAVTRKFSDARTLVELGHVVPADIPTGSAENHTRLVLTALGVRDGVCHTELVLTSEGPRVIEPHLRLAGDEIPNLVRDALGIDPVDCLVPQTFGEAVLAAVRGRLATTTATPQAIWFGTAPCTGTVERIDVPELSGVRFGLEVARGDQVAGLSDSHPRRLWAGAGGPDPTTAIRSAFDAVAACTLVVTAPVTAPEGIGETV